MAVTEKQYRKSLQSNNMKAGHFHQAWLESGGWSLLDSIETISKATAFSHSEDGKYTRRPESLASEDDFQAKGCNCQSAPCLLET